MPLPRRSVEIIENLSQDSWCMSWDSNQTLPTTSRVEHHNTSARYVVS